MDQDYIIVSVLTGSDAINMKLRQGWKIINSQFCLHEEVQATATRRHQDRGWFPYALMGLTREVAVEQGMDIRAITQSQHQAQPAVETVTEPPQAFETVQAPIGTTTRPQPAPQRPNPLESPVNLEKSSEEVVGVRRR